MITHRRCSNVGPRWLLGTIRIVPFSSVAGSTAIHIPVPQYDEGIARRVQRLFDGVQVGRPLWRANSLWHGFPDLHQPKSESLPRRSYGPDAPYFRSERQVIMRLPETRAVVFSIHTFVTRNPGAVSA